MTIRSAVFALALLLLAPFAAEAQNGRVTLLHLNDLQEVAVVRGKGGIAPLMTLLKQERARNPAAITTLGGDFLSPSVLSGLTRGAHMVALLNAAGVDVAAFGNHEFDFGPDVAQTRRGESNFPWLAANVQDAVTGAPFAVNTWTKAVGELTVGFFGLLTPDTAVLSSPGETVRFLPVVPAAAAAVKRLREQGANVVIALTHQTIAEDRAMVREVKGIDLVLGGHDHDPMMVFENNVPILKTGSDFNYLAAIDLAVTTTTGQRGPVTTVAPVGWRTASTAGVPPAPEMAALVKGYTDRLDREMGAVIGRTETELDSRRPAVRGGEAAIGNFVADALRAHHKADIGLFNGGGIRAETLRPAGSALTRADILAEFPFSNSAVLVEIKGSDLMTALENGVSQVEDLSGRFPQVSGMAFTFDPKRPAGRRVVAASVGGKPLDPAAIYRLATADFLLKGGDGYTTLANGWIIVDPTSARLVTTIIMDQMEAAKTIAPKVEGRITVLK